MPSNSINLIPTAPLVNPAVDSLTVVNSFNDLLSVLGSLGIINTANTLVSPKISFDLVTAQSILWTWVGSAPAAWQIWVAPNGGAGYMAASIAGTPTSYYCGVDPSIGGWAYWQIVGVDSGGNQITGQSNVLLVGIDPSTILITPVPLPGGGLNYSPP